MIGTQQIEMNPRGLVVLFAFLVVTVGGAFIANKMALGFAVASVAAIIIFTFSFISQEIALYILICSMLLGPQVVTESAAVGMHRGRGVTLRFDDFLLIVIGLAWFMKMAVNKNLGIFLRTPLNGPIALYLFACVLSTAYGAMVNPRVKPMVATFFILKYFEYFVIYFMAANHLRDKEQIRRFLITMLAVCFCVCLYGIYQIPSVDRVSAPFEGEDASEPNTLGGYLVLMLSLTIGLLATAGSLKRKWPLWILLPAILVTLAATHSRGSWLALPFMLLTLILFSKRRLVLMLPVLFILALSPLVMPKSVIDRVAYTFNQPEEEGQVKIGNVKVDTSTSARLESWRIILTEDFAKRPLLGHGITGYYFVDAQFPMILANTGLVGLTAFFILLGAVFRNAWKAYRASADPLFSGIVLGYLGGCVGLLVHAIGANTFIIVRIMEPFWFLTAIVILIPTMEKKEKGEQPAAS